MSIPPLEAPLPAALASRMSRLLPPGMQAPTLFRAVARNESLFCHLVDSGLLGPTGLLDRRSLPRPLREAVILRTCHANGNGYEWRLHVGTISARMGLSAAQIEDTWAAAPQASLWPDGLHAVLRLVDTLVARQPISPGLRDALRGSFDDATLIEITQLVGLYTGVAMLVQLIEPDADPYAALPPGGKPA